MGFMMISVLLNYSWPVSFIVFIRFSLSPFTTVTGGEFFILMCKKSVFQETYLAEA